jgi:hypothetical protein
MEDWDVNKARARSMGASSVYQQTLSAIASECRDIEPFNISYYAMTAIALVDSACGLPSAEMSIKSPALVALLGTASAIQSRSALNWATSSSLIDVPPTLALASSTTTGIASVFWP